MLKTIISPEINIDAIADKIDPNIIKLLTKVSDHEQISEYLRVLSGDESNMQITYNLKGIYNSNLSYKEIKNVVKMAKEAKKANKKCIHVKKDGFIKRFFGKIKTFIPGTLKDRKNERITEAIEQQNKIYEEVLKEKGMTEEEFKNWIERNPKERQKIEREALSSGLKKGVKVDESRVSSEFVEHASRETEDATR